VPLCLRQTLPRHGRTQLAIHTLEAARFSPITTASGLRPWKCPLPPGDRGRGRPKCDAGPKLQLPATGPQRPANPFSGRLDQLLRRTSASLGLGGDRCPGDGGESPGKVGAGEAAVLGLWPPGSDLLLMPADAADAANRSPARSPARAGGSPMARLEAEPERAASGALSSTSLPAPDPGDALVSSANLERASNRNAENGHWPGNWRREPAKAQGVAQLTAGPGLNLIPGFEQQRGQRLPAA